MTLKAERFLTFTDSNGVSHTLPEQQPAQRFSKVHITCDGPRCKDPLTQDGPVIYEWTEQAAVKDPLSVIPAGVFRIISAEFERGAGPKVFCSVRCLKDYLDYVYVPPMSPAEMEEQRKRNEAVEAKKSIHLVDSTEGTQ